MLLIQCFGRTNLARRLATQSAYIIQPCDALLAALVDHVAPCLDVRGFGQVAQLAEPCDAHLAALVDHVALFLDKRVSVRSAIPHVACAPVVSVNLVLPLQLVFPVDPRANIAHLAELVKRCVFDKNGGGVVIQKRETVPSRNTPHIVVQCHKDTRCGCLLVGGHIDSALGLEEGLGMNHHLKGEVLVEENSL